MNQVQRHSRASSDFSIARILADDNTEKSRASSSSFSATVKIYTESAENSTRQENFGAPVNYANTLSNFRLATGEFSPLVSFGTTGGNNDCSAFERLNTPDMDISRFHSSSEIESQGESSKFPCNPRDLKNLKIERSELSWLQCTRYRPPKLLRKSAAGKSGKRRPGAHPRIPFTTSQLQVLEDKYRKTAYLSRRDVIHLSTLLRLPQSRVKIWFQNRRARDRRETSISGSNVTILSADAPSAYKSQDIPYDNSTAPNLA